MLLQHHSLSNFLFTCVYETNLCALSSLIFQARLPGAGMPKDTTVTETNKTYAHHMVRTDSSLQKLDKFFGSPAATATPSTR